jgi:nitroreductase
MLARDDRRSTPVELVLDKARWAPSGDNTQPWRFRIVSPTEAVIHTFDTRRHCVYDLTGAPSQIAVGALLETARIAATDLGMRARIERLPTPTEEALQFRLALLADGSDERSALIPFIETRCTSRRPYSRQPLTADQKSALEASVGAPYTVIWLEGAKRWEMARLMFRSSWIRLNIREAYDVHASVIEWHSLTSETRIPDRAVGLDPVGLALMRWAMKSWRRTHLLSAYFGGTLLPRLQLELLPALGCAAHALIVADARPTGVDDHVRAGAAVQRFWLTAERLGLRHQPEMTPLIFAGYHREGRAFTTHERAAAVAGQVRSRLAAIAGDSNATNAVWLGRLGFGAAPVARSIRQPLASLLIG